MLDDIVKENIDKTPVNAPAFSIGEGVYYTDEIGDDINSERSTIEGSLVIEYHDCGLYSYIAYKEGQIILQLGLNDGSVSDTDFFVGEPEEVSKKAAEHILDYVEACVSGCNHYPFYGFHDEYEVVLRNLAETIEEYIEDSK